MLRDTLLLAASEIDRYPAVHNSLHVSTAESSECAYVIALAR